MSTYKFYCGLISEYIRTEEPERELGSILSDYDNPSPLRNFSFSDIGHAKITELPNPKDWQFDDEPITAGTCYVRYYSPSLKENATRQGGWHNGRYRDYKFSPYIGRLNGEEFIVWEK